MYILIFLIGVSVFWQTVIWQSAFWQTVIWQKTVRSCNVMAGLIVRLLMLLFYTGIRMTYLNTTLLVF